MYAGNGIFYINCQCQCFKLGFKLVYPIEMQSLNLHVTLRLNARCLPLTCDLYSKVVLRRLRTDKKWFKDRDRFTLN